MYNSKTLLSMAVAAALGATSFAASAEGPTVYGDIAVALTYTTKSTDAGKASYALNDNVSLLGVKGDAAAIEGTKFIYDFNFILNQGGVLPLTHLSTIGLDGGFGTASVGLRENGLFLGMVDGSTYQTNWFYTPGMSALQVSNAITYISKPAGGLKLGVQAFDFGKDGDSGKTTNNYTLAGSYEMGGLTFGLGYTKYSDYADGTAQYTASTDPNQFGEATNTFAGQVLKNTLGLSAGYKTDMFGVVAAYDVRKPTDKLAALDLDPTSATFGDYIVSAQNTSTIKTLMLTGSFSATKTVTLVANVSNTSQSDDGAIKGAKGTIFTLMASYAPADNLFFSIELQNSNKDANETGVTGATGAGGTKSNSGLALGATYSF